MLANSFGVHAIYGGAIQKVSTELDGIFDTGNLANVLFGPSSAVTTLFGVHVFCILMPIIDPLSGNPRNALFMWDGKRWWSASQSVAMIKIMTLEWGSVISAWGLDVAQTTIRQLFANPSSLTTKTLVSRLAREPHIAMQKKGWMLFAMWSGDATLDFTWDTENGSSAVVQGAFVGSGTANWARSKAPDTLGFTAGFTMTSTASAFTLIDVLQLQMDRRLKT